MIKPNLHGRPILKPLWSCLLAALGMVATLDPTVTCRAAEQPLNVVFILADDMGWADLGCYGADLHETPHLDRFAQEAVRFSQAYAAASVCTPTRASIMTGKFPARLHMTVWREEALKPPRNRKLIPPVTVANLPHQEITIAKVLNQAGYFTAAVGKWHLGDAAFYPEVHGFDVNIGGTIWGAPATFFYPYRGAQLWGGEYRYVPGLYGGKPGEYLTDRLTDEALRMIDTAGDKPFFLYLAHHAVHTPIEAKQDVVDQYAKKLKPEMHHQNATYAAMVHSLDENVARVLVKLQQRGLADRTVVIFTSDNGGFIDKFHDTPVTDNYPLRSGKGSLYEGGVRVPLLVKWPGVSRAGGICHEPVFSADFYPTILEMTGLSVEEKQRQALDGLSLVPLLKDPAATLPREALFFHYPHYYTTTSPVSSVRARDWKLLLFQEDNHVELYNLADDPRETKDLAAAHPEKAAQLRQRLEAWLKATDAQMAVPNPDYKARRSADTQQKTEWNAQRLSES